MLTHCNTGALATAAFGTALGVVRALAARGALQHAYCTETRPYNQGGWTLSRPNFCRHKDVGISSGGQAIRAGLMRRPQTMPAHHQPRRPSAQLH